jgi:hypothetical protein
LAFYQKEASSMKQAGLRDMFITAFKSVCTSTFLTPCPTPPNSSAVKTLENTEEDPSDHEP